MEQVVDQAAYVNPGRLAPIPEGTVVPVNPLGNMRNGLYTRVPLIITNTRDETRLLPELQAALDPGAPPAWLISGPSLMAIVTNFDPDMPLGMSDTGYALRIGQIINPYFLPVDSLEVVNGMPRGYRWRNAFATRIFHIANSMDVLDAARAWQPNSVWYSRFDHDEEVPPWNDALGAYHGADVPFWFGTLRTAGMWGRVLDDTARRPSREALSTVMRQTLGAFAWTGDPNHAALGLSWPTWPTGTLLWDSNDGANAIRVTQAP
jgi:para-nitrobenzyl esterase